MTHGSCHWWVLITRCHSIYGLTSLLSENQMSISDEGECFWIICFSEPKGSQPLEPLEILTLETTGFLNECWIRFACKTTDSADYTTHSYRFMSAPFLFRFGKSLRGVLPLHFGGVPSTLQVTCWSPPNGQFIRMVVVVVLEKPGLRDIFSKTCLYQKLSSDCFRAESSF